MSLDKSKLYFFLRIYVVYLGFEKRRENANFLWWWFCPLFLRISFEKNLRIALVKICYFFENVEQVVSK